MKSFIKYGTFCIFVDGEFLMRVSCSYGEVLDYVWPIHFEHPDCTIEIRTLTGFED